MTVEFYTQETCAPCKMMKPMVQKLIDERGYEVEEIKAEEKIEVFNLRGVVSTPTMILLDESGKELRRASGAMTKPNFIKFVEGA